MKKVLYSGYTKAIALVLCVASVVSVSLTAARGILDYFREGEGVSILSIHRSKGLECPVVLVCGLSRRFNRDDLMRPVLFHAQLGVGPKGLDRERMVEYPTLARRAVARQLEREMMAEELRLLYVAMTRAQEKLILVASLASAEKKLGDLNALSALPEYAPLVERAAPLRAAAVLGQRRGRGHRRAHRRERGTVRGADECPGGGAGDGELLLRQPQRAG